MKEPNKNIINELLSYDAESGSLVWKERSAEKFSSQRASNAWNARYPGKVAGMLNKKNGYLYVGINGIQYLAHRVVWVMLNKTIPAGMQIDHINHVRTDNRINNLRIVTCQENRMNCSKMSTNTSGVSGVGWVKREKKWRVRIKINKREIGIGYFSDKKDAIAARKAAEIKYGFHENHGSAKPL